MTTPVQQTVALTNLQPSRTNPRKHFDKGALEELTESVRKHGVLQPLLVRPVNGHMEIVAGERRYRAAKTAALEEIPVVVRELSDTEALEIQVVENLQRSDLHPLEEAEGYQLLHEKHGYSVEDLAAKVGKSKAYIYSRLKLTGLPVPARKAFLDDQVSPSTALLIARIPDRKLAEKATKEILAGRWDGGERVPMTFRQAKEHIQDDYMLQLKGAPFPANDTDLVPEAGPCSTCPHRTGNAPDLFGDVGRADVCTNPPCFRKKVDAAWARKQAEASEKGVKILSDKEAKKIFPYGSDQLSYDAPFVKITERCYDDPKARSYQKLLGKHAPAPVLVRDPEGGIHELIPKDKIPAALKAAGHKWGTSRTSTTVSRGPEEKRRQRAHQLRTKTIQASIGDLVARAEKFKDEKAFLRFVATDLFHGHAEPVKALAARRGWKLGQGYMKRAPVKELEKLTVGQLRGVIVELIAMDMASSTWSSEYGVGWRAAAKLLRFNTAAAQRRVASELAAKKKTIRKKPGRRKATKKRR